MHDSLLEKLKWRYATKQFDPGKSIPDEHWATLEEALVLTPSSYGLQPWQFFVIRDRELKDSLVPACYNQRQPADCSHLLVIAVKTELSEADVDRLIDATCAARDTTRESLEFYRNLIIGDVVTGPRSGDVTGWAKLQSYIALGNFMTCAALLGIDCCPMEGFVPEQVDAALGLPEKGLTTAVLCPAGYRDPTDKHAGLAKVRYPANELITRIG